MTEQELAAIEALANAATPGAWHHRGDHTVIAESQWIGPDQVAACSHPNEAAFIAASRLTVPKLVAEVRRLRAENARLKAPPFNPEAAALGGMPDWEIQRRGLQGR